MPDSRPEPTGSRRLRTAVIYNPTKVNQPRLRRAIAAVERDRDWRPSVWLETERHDAGAGAAHKALAQEVDLIIAAGGDGTVRAVASELVDTQVPLLIIPVGATNLFATNLGLRSRGYTRALRRALAGQPFSVGAGRIELTRADGGLESLRFFVITGFGLDEHMVRNTSAKHKNALRWPAYIPAIITSLRSRASSRVRIRLDGQDQGWQQAHTVMTGSCGRLPTGISILPNAHPARGSFDVLTMRSLAPLNLVRFMAWLVRKNLPAGRNQRRRQRDSSHNTTLSYREAHSVTLDFEGPMAFQADGESIGEATAAQIDHLPDAIRVMLPVGTTWPGLRSHVARASELQRSCLPDTADRRKP
ncbi:diacylglycerol kinase family protein [Saxibacter everestensis]|uniref:Diacylglycerol kinase family protein n=1 Tax=Saxibacter everestensis TaxID=2909229 RepID=A0ABY8QZD4_9MICO|nr:diacylglycerol kinase family protein [Brevibacteriaceae bacterium ZFBP1038]